MLINQLGSICSTGLFLLMLTSSLTAETSSHFLCDGPASIGGAVGGAMTAYPNDYEAVYWNPAGLVDQNSNVFVDHQNTNEDAATSWVGVAGGNKLAKFWLNWKHGELPLDSSKDAILIGMGFNHSIIPGFSKLSGFSIGTTLGRVIQNIVGASASSYLADIGLLWRGDMGPWRLSAGGVGEIPSHEVSFVPSTSRQRTIVIKDNAMCHPAKLYVGWRKQCTPRFMLDFLPPYSMDLGSIARLWKLTRCLCLDIRYFPTRENVIVSVEPKFNEWVLVNDVFTR